MSDDDNSLLLPCSRSHLCASLRSITTVTDVSKEYFFDSLEICHWKGGSNCRFQLDMPTIFRKSDIGVNIDRNANNWPQTTIGMPNDNKKNQRSDVDGLVNDISCLYDDGEYMVHPNPNPSKKPHRTSPCIDTYMVNSLGHQKAVPADQHKFPGDEYVGL
jgi:hypothetical protein